jgi:tripartite-type tricarboxylate transporter receptor subunit TctC
MHQMNRRQLLAAAVAAPLVAAPARAAAYPDRPIRVIIPYTSGGVPETIMRLLAVQMEQRLGQKLVIEAKSGAAGNIGTQEVAHATPDGYTVLFAATNNFVINQFLIKLTFDPLTDLVPVAKVADVPLVLFCNPAVPARSLAELIAYAKANPGKLSYGSPSSGTVNHLLVERLKQEAGVDITHIPFRGSAAAALALLANDIQFLPIGLAVGAPYLADGRLVAIAVASAKRWPLLPDVATVAESGFPGFAAENWWALAVPKETPAAVTEALRAAAAQAMAGQLVTDRFATMGMTAPPESREEFAASLRAEAGLWSQIITRGNIAIQ